MYNRRIVTNNQSISNNYSSMGTSRPSYSEIKKAEQRVVHRGDIYFSYRNYEESIGSEFTKGHPCVIVSSEELCEKSSVVCAVYLTSAPREDLDTHVVINNDKINSTAICEQIVSISKSRLGREPIAHVSDEELNLIDRAMASSLGFGLYQSSKDLPTELATLRTERDTYKKMYDSLINRITKNK